MAKKTEFPPVKFILNGKEITKEEAIAHMERKNREDEMRIAKGA